MEFIKFLLVFVGTVFSGTALFWIIGQFLKGFIGFFINVTKIRVGAAPFTEEQYDRWIGYIFAGFLLAIIILIIYGV